MNSSSFIWAVLTWQEEEGRAVDMAGKRVHASPNVHPFPCTPCYHTIVAELALPQVLTPNGYNTTFIIIRVIMNTQEGQYYLDCMS